MRWKLMSNPSGVTAPTAVQKGATELSVGNGGNVPGALLLFSQVSGSAIKPKTIPYPYTDIISAKNTYENLGADGNNKWQF